MSMQFAMQAVSAQIPLLTNSATGIAVGVSVGWYVESDRTRSAKTISTGVNQ